MGKPQNDASAPQVAVATETTAPPTPAFAPPPKPDPVHRRAEAITHLDVAIAEFREMEMAPLLGAISRSSAVGELALACLSRRGDGL